MTTKFEALPIEIIEGIVVYLPACDVLQLRQTSRTIYDKTNAFCARKLFGTISTDLSLDELHWLSTSLASNQQICNAIRTIEVNIKDDSRGLGYDYYWNRRSREKHLILPCDGFEALRTLLQPHLLNCNTFRLLARDLSSATDFPSDRLEPADVIQLLLLLAAEEAIRLDRLEIGSPSHGTHLNAERLPVETLTDSNVLTMLGHIRTLSIKLVYSDELVDSGWLCSFFAACKHLRNLSVDLDMSWGEIEVTSRLINSLQCRTLENLHLSRFKTSLITLNAFTEQSCESLHTLHLCLVTIVSSASVGYCRWKHWLSSLHSTLPQLAAIRLDLLSTTHISAGKLHLHFSSVSHLLQLDDPSAQEYMLRPSKEKTFECLVPPPCDSEMPPLQLEVFSHGWTRADQLVLSGVKYEGTDMRRALDFIAEHAEDMSII